MTDQQRGDTVLPGSSCITPNMDQFREQSLSFTQAYCPSPHCCPSRASFFTGLYPSQHGVWNNVAVQNCLSKGLKPDISLWSDDLYANGYTLDWSGKWHVSFTEGPADRNWNVHSITAGPQNAGFSYMDFTWEKYKTLARQNKNETPKPRKPGQFTRPGYPPFTLYGSHENPFNDQDYVTKANEVIRSRKNQTNPWCHFIGPLGPHDPYIVPQRFLDLYDNVLIELPENVDDKLTNKPNLYKKTQNIFNQLSREEHKEAIKHYLAFCSYEDYLFGQVLDALEESGQSENTIVIYCSDHGDYMAEHGLWCKGLPCFKGAYHIPFIVKWPDGLKQKGRTNDAFVSLTDFAPTILEIAGIETDRKFDGQSLLPFLLNNQPANWRDAIHTQSNGNELYGIQRSITTREWKYVYNGFDFDELYNLKNDPLEMNNLINDPKHNSIIKELAARNWKFAHETGDVCTNPYIMTGLASYGPATAFE